MSDFLASSRRQRRTSHGNVVGTSFSFFASALLTFPFSFPFLSVLLFGVLPSFLLVWFSRSDG
jgi:hypothetical protein